MTTKITKEFLKETITNVLAERLSDEQLVAYGRRNKALARTDAYRQAVARLAAKQAAAKKPEKPKMQRGLASLFRGSDLTKDLEKRVAPEPGEDVRNIAKDKDEEDRFMKGLKSYFSSMVREGGEETLREFFEEIINETNLEESNCGKRDDSGEKCGNKACKDCYPVKEELELEEAKKCPHCDGDAPKSECICGKVEEAAKPDYIDIDGDGDKEESMKKAAADKKKQEESKIQTPEQENTLYEQRFAPKNNRLFEKLVKEWTK